MSCKNKLARCKVHEVSLIGTDHRWYNQSCLDFCPSNIPNFESQTVVCMDSQYKAGTVNNRPT